jgi:hypothetical protein
MATHLATVWWPPTSPGILAVVAGAPPQWPHRHSSATIFEDLFILKNISQFFNFYKTIKILPNQFSMFLKCDPHKISSQLYLFQNTSQKFTKQTLIFLTRKREI